MRWLLKAAGFPLALIPSVALPLLLVASAEDHAGAGEEAYRALPELPAAAPADSVADLEAAAVELAARLRAVPLSPAAEEVCPADRLEVSWSEPGDDYAWGAHLEPVGPRPGTGVDEVNGVVLCEGSRHAFMGFEAWRTDGDWALAAVPYVHEEAEAHVEAPAPAAPPVVQAPAVPAPAAPVPAPLSLDLPTGAIEGYAAYEPQRLCDPTPKPGTLALRNLLLGNNPGTRNLGISRACGAGGQSEHKEGRALDWGVLVSRPNERAAAETFIAQLLATDAAGNRHAMARRMGVMYVIWNRQIWSAYRASAGWRPYGGASPHTDHVHVSLSWAGAQGRTSFWSGKVDPSTLLAFQPALPSGGSGGAPAPAAPAGNSRRRRAVAALPGSLPTEAVRDAVDEGRRRGRRGKDGERGEWRRRWEELSEEERSALLAPHAEAKSDEARHLAEAQRRAEAERQAAAQREAARQAEAQRQAERQQQREAARQAEAQRQAERGQQRDAQRQAERERRAEVDQRRQRRRDEGGERRRRRGEWRQGEQAQAAPGGGGERRGHGGGRGKGHGKGKSHGKGGGKG